MNLLVRLGSVAAVSQGLAMSGRGAGAQPGDWRVWMVNVGSIDDDRLLADAVEEIAIDRNVRTEKHLLRPHDVLVTARSTLVKVALVPPGATRMVANATLLVARPHEPESGMGQFLWWYLTSTHGRMQVLARMVTSSTLLSLSAASLAEMDVPLPSGRELGRIADVVDVSERAYAAAIEAARLRRTLFRDDMIDRLRAMGGEG